MTNNFAVVDLLSLKLLIFRLIKTYFGTLRTHQIAPFLSTFLKEHAPRTPSMGVNPHHCRVPTNLVCNYLSS